MRLLERTGERPLWSDQAVLARPTTNWPWSATPWVGPASPIGPPPTARAGGGRRSGEPGSISRSGEKERPFGSPAGAPASGDAVELATFHRAKGLEWISVNVIGLEEGYVPIVYAQSDQAQAEERRLLYVAMTRASSDLHCSWARVRTMGRAAERAATAIAWSGRRGPGGPRR